MNAKTISLGCLGLLCVGLLLMTFPIGLRQYRVQAQLQAIASAGDPVSLAELGDPTPVSVWPMAEKVNARNEIQQIIDPAESLAKTFHSYLNSDAAHELRQPLSAEQVALMENGFQQYPKVLPALRDASHCQRYAWPSPTTPSGVMPPDQYMQVLLKEVSRLRMVGRLMLCGARFLATKGKVDESAMLCVDLIRLTGLQESGPTVVVYQTNVAIRQSAVDQLNAIMQVTPLDPGTHAAIEMELAVQEASDAFLDALKTERVFGVASIQAMPATLRVFSNQMSEYLAAMQDQIDRGKTPPCDWSNRLGPPVEVMTQSAMTAMDSARAAFERDRIRCRCLRILNAIRVKELVAAEVNLDQLGLPAEATQDPYSGRPLVIETVKTELEQFESESVASGEGWRIHSMGPNPFQNTANHGTSQDLGLTP